MVWRHSNARAHETPRSGYFCHRRHNGSRRAKYRLQSAAASRVRRTSTDACPGAKDEGLFTCSRSQLGTLMDAAKGSLAWIDWTSLRKGGRRRNAVAHDGALFEGKECIQDIANVEAQLTAWGIIDPI